MSKYAGAEWLESQIKHWKPTAEISDLGRNVADFLGELFFGIYHLDYKALKRVDWSSNHHIEIVLRDGGQLATTDFDTLSRLVFLAHHMAIRVELNAASPKHIRYFFSQRQRGGAVYERHPDLDEAVEKFHRDVSFDPFSNPPMAELPYNPDKPMCQDDYEYFTKAGQYATPRAGTVGGKE